MGLSRYQFSSGFDFSVETSEYAAGGFKAVVSAGIDCAMDFLKFSIFAADQSKNFLMGIRYKLLKNRTLDVTVVMR